MGAGCCGAKKGEVSQERRGYGDDFSEESESEIGVTQRGPSQMCVVNLKRMSNHIGGVHSRQDSIAGSRSSRRGRRCLDDSSIPDSQTFIASEVDTQPASIPPSPTLPSCWARLIALDCQYKSINIYEHTFHFGREIFKNKLVSHTQFVVTLLDAKTRSVEVEDKSINGTFLNGRAAQGRQSLQHGDKISFRVSTAAGMKTMFPGYIFDLTSGSNPEGRGYKVGECVLGSGANATVHLGFKAGKLIAVKKIHMSSELSSEQFAERQKEIDILSLLSHNNIVTYIGCDIARGVFNVLLGFVPGGSISSLLSKFGSFDEHVCRMYLVQILAGLRYLHENGVIHMDIKGGNILVTPEGVCKLADFGAATKVVGKGEQQIKKFLGTPLWTAPEVMRDQRFTRGSDIWSLGCVLVEMASGKHPYAERNFDNPLSVIIFQRSNAATPPVTPEKLSEAGASFLSSCFELSPSKRGTAAELLHHRFIKSNPTPHSHIDSGSDFNQINSVKSFTYDFTSLPLGDASPPASFGYSSSVNLGSICGRSR